MYNNKCNISRTMYVIKRNLKPEPVQFDKITERISRLTVQDGLPLLENADPIIIAQKVIGGVRSGMTTRELDILASETAAYMSPVHPEYESLASRIVISNLHKETCGNIMEVAKMMYEYVDVESGTPAPLLSVECYEIIMEFGTRLQAAIKYERDYSYDFFGFKTLEKTYLAKISGNIVERPQDLLMRVAVGIHKRDIDSVIDTYNLMSMKYYTHATPTLYNSGTRTPQMSSCFLLATKDDSIKGIYSTLADCALISQSAGGIGFSVHNVRASGSYIRGNNGRSNGLVPMLRVFNNTARYVDQGSRRKGAFACYLEPWHADIEDWIDLKKNHGKEESRARDLFYGLWIPDLFMRRVESNSMWSLMCPNECRGLYDCWGPAFDKLYEQYESEGKCRRRIRAQELWTKIVTAQIEVGMPYMLFKDACNAKSNQQHLGTIRSSNLCTEIIQYSSATETSVCNLSSIALPMFVVNGKFDHNLLYDVVYRVTQSLDKVIDENYYPTEETRRSNMKHRPIGIGVQGLADTFCMLRMPFDSAAAKRLNIEIFETMYYAAATSSCDRARQLGPYESFVGSPASRGILCPDMWANVQYSGRWDFDTLRTKITACGMRNSLLLAPMPTASTSQILGFNECFEPFTSNIYTRRVLAGEFIVLNKYLMRDLISHNLWNEEMRHKIIARGGSVQGIAEIPVDLQLLYRTVWELKMKDLMDMSADRARFIDQSQSFNAFMETPTFAKVSSMHFYGWKLGLKTGMYYLHTRPAVNAIQFTVDRDLAAMNPVAATRPTVRTSVKSPVRSPRRIMEIAATTTSNDEMTECPTDGSCEMCGS